MTLHVSTQFYGNYKKGHLKMMHVWRYGELLVINAWWGALLKRITVNVLKFPTLFSLSSQITCWFSGLELPKYLSG